MKKLIFIPLFLFLTLPLKAQIKTAHIIVALCDNVYQNIAPVPAKLGNGSNPEQNLYWGAMYGVKTHLKKSPEWSFVSEEKDISPDILRRIIFKHKDKDYWVILDAYKGKEIKTATKDFFNYLSKVQKNSLEAVLDNQKQNIPFGSASDIIIYAGHNGLMDFTINTPEGKKSSKKAVVLACQSKKYLNDAILKTGAESYVTTNGNMAPEGYVIEAVLNSWAGGKDSAKARKAAAQAYAKYQKVKSADYLFR
ncbi:hypothetical protein Emin_0008 [Elusimicrobium minutum Pei191]|uniref:Uncharacterized protein n=1 Tax=Elusimicrobium minutum (strain Pei191) TaxID=445932 RepID=B2KAN0_ELUMP|nr:hypothetical protein [Elusimicrobium minutum]ACC97576.1 hypothetical protein Emin_0008 [Elusimicrobium minutum Pei191]